MHIKMIGGESCNRCRFIEPHLKSRAEKQGYEFEEKDISAASQEELEGASALPVIWMDGEQKDYDDVILMLSA